MTMVFILDDRSFHYAYSELTYFASYVRNMFWPTILYKYYGYDPLPTNS